MNKKISPSATIDNLRLIFLPLPFACQVLRQPFKSCGRRARKNP
ncbi:hypothetical protein Cabys_566 [Caldithrix abyssi DSM 13497]|uniref:Uncharacterized protein n=1 Tax=Caldithrix abyssi DSM 13497 TaxID=880073 RepID=A0A1J1C3Q0_CALAY|nr:hypothetical protein Cabys_566 [Caldithrix abyssi DSM 13497]